MSQNNDNDIRIRIEDEPVRISLSDPCPVKLSFNDEIVIKQIEPDHRRLSNLDYENSGHVGFMPNKLSLLPELPSTTSNRNLRMSLFDTNTEESYVVDFDDVRKRIIKTEGSSYVHTNKDEYVFIEINNENK